MMPAGLLTVRNFPFLMRAILSHLPASSIYGVETRIVIPSFFSLPSISQNSFLETGSTPVVGSSRNRTFGLWISAQQRASFCFIPPDSFPAILALNGSICL